MNVLKFIKKNMIVPTLCGSSIIMLIFLLFTEFLYSTGISTNSKPALTFANAMLCVLLAFLFSLCNLIFSIQKLSLISKTFLHFAAVVLSVIIVVLLTDYSFSSSSFLLLVFFIILYFISVPPILIIHNSISRKASEEKNYKSIFSK